MKNIAPNDKEDREALCSSCGQPVYSYLCNEQLIKARPEAICWDWWYSCSNEKCENHYGEGYFQHDPIWVL